MDTEREGMEGGDRRPVFQAGRARSGQSGEGSRSALEQLLRQEKARNAQSPRDTGAEAPEDQARA